MKTFKPFIYKGKRKYQKRRGLEDRLRPELGEAKLRYEQLCSARSCMAVAFRNLQLANEKGGRLSLHRLSALAGIPYASALEFYWLAEIGWASRASSATIMEAGTLARVYPQRRTQILDMVGFNAKLSPTQLRALAQDLLKMSQNDIGDTKRLEKMARQAEERPLGRRKANPA